MSTIEFEVQDHIAIITLNRPAQRNAIDLTMRLEMVKCFNRIRHDSDIHVGVITGTGTSFSAGHDLKETMTEEEKANDPSTAGLYQAFRAVGKPAIAAINGACIAQGSGLALLSDVRFGTENTKFGWPQVKFGMPSNSGPTILTRMMPWNIAMEYLMTGEFIDAETSLKHHLLNRIVPQDKLMDETMAFARLVAANPPRGIQAVKRVADATINMDLGVAFDVAVQLIDGALNDPGVDKGLEAFASKNKSK